MRDEGATITLLDTGIPKKLQHATDGLVRLNRTLHVWRIFSEFGTHGHRALESFFVA